MAFRSNVGGNGECYANLNKSGSERHIFFHSYVDPEKLNRKPAGRGRGKKVTEREGGKP